MSTKVRFRGWFQSPITLAWVGMAGLLLVSLLSVGALAETNGVTREVYANLPGGTIADLTNSTIFPASPTLETLQPAFEAPAEFSDNYGTRMSALLVPPLTGSYTFWIASDDQGSLFISTDETPAKRQLICYVSSWSGSREWARETNQQSAPIPLIAGRRYYIEALQKEGGGGDNLAVRWQLPNGVIEEPIPNQRVIAVGLTPPVITQQPAGAAVVESGTAVFTIRLQRYLGATFQWLRNDVIIPEATLPTLTVGPVQLSDSGSKFRCIVTNPQGTTNSAAATLVVSLDITKPTISSVANFGDPTAVSIVFSEPVEPASATNAANYAINNGVAVRQARMGMDSRTVLLTTSPMGAASTNTLTVNNVRDRASSPNAILANSTALFTTVVRPADIAMLRPAFEPPGPASRRHGVVISEIMYHPLARPDGRDASFVEIYNSQPWFEEIGGWRISGAVDYTFPSNTVIQARSRLVVAARPADFSVVYPTFNGVFGPFATTNGLPHDSGTLRLRNARDAVLFETTYKDVAPWPIAADGAGHSLILARASYGDRDPRAWDASDLAGGTPGNPDVQTANIYKTLFINEVLAHTDLPEVDYVEIFNYSQTPASLTGCILTDDPATNKFTIGSLNLPPRSFKVFTSAELGFALSAAGETIYLKAPLGTRVIDAVRFGGQQNGVPFGRYPDGSPALRPLSRSSPGTNNAPPRLPDVVLNEIMYNPISGDSDDEYVELLNRSTNAVALGGWRLEDAVRYTFPEGTTLAPGAFLVVARNAARLRTNYVQINSHNSIGDFAGTLANSGDHLALTMPDTVVSTNDTGVLETNLIHIVQHEVAWQTGGRWGSWSDGGGSSLELCDTRAYPQAAPSWADSDEFSRSPWVVVEATGTMDNGYADATQLHVTLLGPGEALLDNVEVIPAGGTNLITNSTFESGTNSWVFQGNHNRTSLETGEGFQSQQSLHLRAAGRGDTGANRVRAQLASTPAAGTVVTLRARARWLKGNPNILLRLRGNWHEAPGRTLATTRLGTPGLPNSNATPNSPPAITGARHWPTLPAGGAAVTVSAFVEDPDNLAHVAVNYRIDPATNYSVVLMTNAGAGLFTASIPGQAAGASAAFFIEAVDNHLTPARSRFPANAPAREAIVRWGDNLPQSSLGIYRFWMSQTNLDRWIGQELMSNDPKDITFIYGTNRVIYNAGGMFHGSPYHSPAYNSPIGNSCDYDLVMPPDEPILGATDLSLFRPGNGGGDGTAQAEIQGYWFGDQFGVPFLYCRPVFVFANGVRREEVILDAQQPNGDFVDQWHPDDAGGDLHKIQIGFEFGDTASGANEAGYSAVGADLSRYTTTGGAMKLARYRQTWQRRAASNDEVNDFAHIYHLVDVVQTNAAPGTEAYTLALTSAVDVEEWFKVHVTEHLFNNYDSFSYGGGQNAFAYKPQRGTWKLYLWDIDFAFGGPADDPNLTSIGGREHGPVNYHPPFARIYWQALIEATRGMLTAGRANRILDARYTGLRAGGANVASPQGIKDFIAARRAFILSVIASNQAPFALLSNNGADFTTNRNLVSLTGTAPLEVRTLLVNGSPGNVAWTSSTNWVLKVPLGAGTNTLTLTGIDPSGATVTNSTRTVRVRFTGEPEPPERVVINEIHYHPAVPDTSFVELLNTATNTTFDLTGWRLEGVDFTFPPATVLEPGAYAVIAADATRFTETYGILSNLVGSFRGSLENGGETLRLVIPGPTPDLDRVLNQVRYDDQPPWPTLADGFGPSLQLIDALQDNSRAGNWGAARVETNNAPQSLVTFTNLWRFNQTAAFTDSAWTSPTFDDTSWTAGRGALFVETADIPAPKSTPLSLGRLTYYFRTKFQFTGVPSSYSLVLQTVLDDSAVVYLNGKELTRIRIDPGPVTYDTLANAGVGDAILEGPFILPGSGLVKGMNTLAVEVHQSSAGSSDIVMALSLTASSGNTMPVTPGGPNSIAATIPPFPPVWLNEIQPVNLSGVVDNVGEREPWVEVFNGGTTNLNLGGWFLSDDYTNLTRWSFPAGTLLAPGQFRLIWLDGETNETAGNSLHTSFRATAPTGSLALSRLVGGSPLIIDYLDYNLPVPGWTFGSVPEGQASIRRGMARPTPAGTNDSALPDVQVTINEWMADNTSTLADPADGQFEDWFELHNTGNTPADLANCWLTDNLTNAFQFRIPAGYAIPPGGYLLVWADGETGQNTATNADLHVSFKLAADGEAIGLYSASGALIDAVQFGRQTNDISMGRLPGTLGTVGYLAQATPRAANGTGSSEAPRLTAIVQDADGRVVLTWTTTPGRRYQVEFKSLLSEPAWTPLTQPVAATDETQSLGDVIAPHPERYYRIVRVD